MKLLIISYIKKINSKGLEPSP